MSHWQTVIADAVKARGYDGQGMTKEQFCFSQLCKAIEELAEVGSCFGVDGDTYIAIRELKEAARFAKVYFNRPERMGRVSLHAPTLAHELADVLITLAMAADALGVDLESLAVEKANRDIPRGVKSGTSDT